MCIRDRIHCIHRRLNTLIGLHLGVERVPQLSSYHADLSLSHCYKDEVTSQNYHFVGRAKSYHPVSYTHLDVYKRQPITSAGIEK